MTKKSLILTIALPFLLSSAVYAMELEEGAVRGVVRRQVFSHAEDVPDDMLRENPDINAYPFCYQQPEFSEELIISMGFGQYKDNPDFKELFRTNDETDKKTSFYELLNNRSYQLMKGTSKEFPLVHAQTRKINQDLVNQLIKKYDEVSGNLHGKYPLVSPDIVQENEEKPLGAVGGRAPLAFSTVEEIPDQTLKNYPNIRDYQFVPKDDSNINDHVINHYGDTKKLKSMGNFIAILEEYGLLTDQADFFSKLAEKILDASRGAPNAEYSDGKPMLDQKVRQENEEKVKELDKKRENLRDQALKIAAQLEFKDPTLPEGVLLKTFQELMKAVGATQKGDDEREKLNLIPFLDINFCANFILTITEIKECLFLPNELENFENNMPPEKDYKKRAYQVARKVLELND